MSDGRYAVIDENNALINVIVWDGVTPYDPGPGLSLVIINEGVSYGPGWIYDPETQTFIDPTPPPPPPPEDPVP